MLPKGLLPETSHYFIAGGWAVCPALADDRDVFVQTTYDLDDARQEILDHLVDAAQSNTKMIVTEEVSDDTVKDGNVWDEYGLLQVKKVAKVTIRGEKPIHIMVTNADPEDIINSFDISTCQVAITETGRVVKGVNFTGPHEAPRKIKNTPTTNARLIKYQDRFGHTDTGLNTDVF